MAATRLSDVIVPEIFTPYTVQRTTELSNIIQSGIAARSPELNNLVSGGGSTFNLPYFNDLTGDAEVIIDNQALTVNSISTERQVGVALNLAKSFGSSFLAQYVSGEDPMRVIGDQLAEYWVRQEQKILVNILKAVFASTSDIYSSHVNDQTTTAITANMMIDTVSKLGDAYGKLSAMVCHSAIYASLRKLNLIQYVTEPILQPKTFPQFMGLDVIVDDGVEVTGAGPYSYRTYVFAQGAISYGQAALDPADATELDRDSLKSEDVLISRRRMIMHPNGFKWTGASMAGSSPTYAEMATATNWDKVFDNKNIPMTCLISGV